MALFDNLQDEVADKFQLGDKAGALLSALVDLITSGGLASFLDKFRRVGLGEIAETWVSRGANTPLSVQQTEDALGTETINTLASKAGLSSNVATSALAFMIPAVVDLLTPDGIVADNRNIVAAPASQEVTATTQNGDNPSLRWLLPLLIIGLLFAITIWLLTRPNQTVRLATPNTNKSANSTVR